MCHIARLLNCRARFSLDTLRASLNKSPMLHDDPQPRKHSVDSLYMPASPEPGTPSKSALAMCKKEPHVARWPGATRGRCATLLRACQCRPTPRALPLQNSKAYCRCSSPLDTSATNLPGMQSKSVLWKCNSLEMIKRKKSPSACAMVWIVASDKGIHSRASSHKPMRSAMSSLYATSTHSCTTRNPQAVAIFKYQEKTPSGDSRHVLPASISKGKLT